MTATTTATSESVLERIPRIILQMAMLDPDCPPETYEDEEMKALLLEFAQVVQDPSHGYFSSSCSTTTSDDDDDDDDYDDDENKKLDEAEEQFVTWNKNPSLYNQVPEEVTFEVAAAVAADLPLDDSVSPPPPSPPSSTSSSLETTMSTNKKKCHLQNKQQQKCRTVIKKVNYTKKQHARSTTMKYHHPPQE